MGGIETSYPYSVSFQANPGQSDMYNAEDIEEVKMSNVIIGVSYDRCHKLLFLLVNGLCTTHYGPHIFYFIIFSFGKSKKYIK